MFLSDNQISMLQADIDAFVMFYRLNWPYESIIPKLHMLKDHVVPFIKKWHVGCGFYGKQGGESIHKDINCMKRSYSCVRNSH